MLLKTVLIHKIFESLFKSIAYQHSCDIPEELCCSSVLQSNEDFEHIFCCIHESLPHSLLWEWWVTLLLLRITVTFSGPYAANFSFRTTGHFSLIPVSVWRTRTLNEGWFSFQLSIVLSSAEEWCRWPDRTFSALSTDSETITDNILQTILMKHLVVGQR